MIDGYKTIPDEKFPKGMTVLINIWFAKWKRIRDPSPEQWDECLAEAVRITEQGEYTVLISVAQALMTELDERWRVRQQQ